VLGMTIRDEIGDDVHAMRQVWTIGGMQLMSDPDFVGPEGRLAHLGVMVEDQAAALRERAEQSGIRAYLVDDPDQVQRDWFEGVKVIGVTAGASSPETLVRRIVERIQLFCGGLPVEEFGEREPAIVFTPPRELTAMQREAAAAR